VAVSEDERRPHAKVDGTHEARAHATRVGDDAPQDHPAAHHQHDEAPGLEREEAEEACAAALEDARDRLFRHAVQEQVRLQHAQRKPDGERPCVPRSAAGQVAKTAHDEDRGADEPHDRGGVQLHANAHGKEAGVPSGQALVVGHERPLMGVWLRQAGGRTRQA